MNICKDKNRAFTIIELIVVIAIISVLASIVLVNLNGIKNKAKDVAAKATGIQFVKAIQICDMNGGKVTVPNSATNPTNNLCTLGDGYGIWPSAPQGWNWYQYVWVSGEENLIYLTSTYNGKLMHCGHYPPLSTYYCSPNPGGVHVGLCRLVQGFSCTVYNPSNGIWE